MPPVLGAIKRIKCMVNLKDLLCIVHRLGWCHIITIRTSEKRRRITWWLFFLPKKISGVICCKASRMRTSSPSDRRVDPTVELDPATLQPSANGRWFG